MTVMPLTDADKRFTLGTRRGFTPTCEPISDTAGTPFGLTLRTAPNSGNLRGAKKNATQNVTEVTSDGNGEDEDVAFDVTDD